MQDRIGRLNSDWATGWTFRDSNPGRETDFYLFQNVWFVSGGTSIYIGLFVGLRISTVISGSVCHQS